MPDDKVPAAPLLTEESRYLLTIEAEYVDDDGTELFITGSPGWFVNLSDRVAGMPGVVEPLPKSPQA